MAKRKYTEAQAKAQKKYAAANLKQVSVRLNRKTDADIIEKLESVENVQGYIKTVIREDIAKK